MDSRDFRFMSVLLLLGLVVLSAVASYERHRLRVRIEALEAHHAEAPDAR